MSTTKPLPILIVGAGISGLAHARLLSRHSVPHLIFEKEPRLARQGFGITARDWAWDPLLAQVGISEADFVRRVAVDGAVGGKGELELSLWDLATGKAILPQPKATTGSPQSKMTRANRNLLREFLMDGVEVRFEHELVDVKVLNDQNGTSVTAVFGNGQAVQGSCIVGADGVNSVGTFLELEISSIPILMT